MTLTRHPATGELNPEQKRAILRRRAEDLARPGQAESGPQQSLDLIVFRLAEETYAIESEFVREVIDLKSYTPLPGVPAFVLGIVNLRGEIISVVDLKKFFNLPARGLGELNKVIVLRDQVMEFGLLADAILGVQNLPLAGINPAPPTLTGIGAQYLRGVTADRVALLDGRTILGDENLIVRQTAQRFLLAGG